MTKPLKLLKEWPEAFNMVKSLQFPMPCFRISLKKSGWSHAKNPKRQQSKEEISQQTSSVEKVARAGSCAKFIIRQQWGLSR